MKQKDLAVLGLVIVLSAILSIFVSKYVFGKPANFQQKVETVNPISSDFTQPSNTYFNAGSIDPTQTINVGLGNNTTPFGNSINQ